MNLVEEIKRHGVGILIDEGSHRAELRRLSKSLEYPFDEVRRIALAHGMSPGEFQSLLRQPVDRSKPNGQHNAAHVGGRNNYQGGGGDQTRPARRLEFDLLSNVRPLPIRWLWRDFIPQGKLVLFTGEPDAGKTLCAVDIAARITNGDHWPDGSGKAPRGSVIFITSEDGIADTIRTRAEAAGANLERIAFLKATRDEKGNRSVFSLQADLDQLGEKVTALGDVLGIIVDPLTAYLGAGKIDTHRAADVRGVLTPLAEFAEQHCLTVIGITHPSKLVAGGKAMNSVGGSGAFIAQSRAAFLFVRDHSKQLTMMLPIKSNLGPRKQGMSFRIETLSITGGIIAPNIVWDTALLTVTADEALAAAAAVRAHEDEPTAKDDVVDFLRHLLAEGPRAVADIEAEARAAGMLGSTTPINKDKPFRAAKEKLRIRSYQRAGQKNGGWVWEIPQFDDQAPFEGSGAHQIVRAPDGVEGA
jgi:putative DNA primase/helicase